MIKGTLGVNAVLRINRYIVGCKYNRRFRYLAERRELIDT